MNFEIVLCRRSRSLAERTRIRAGGARKFQKFTIRRQISPRCTPERGNTHNSEVDLLILKVERLRMYVCGRHFGAAQPLFALVCAARGRARRAAK
jgi:hypothetical protein